MRYDGMRQASMMEREREKRKRKAFTAEMGKKRSALRKPLGGLDLVGWRSCSGARSSLCKLAAVHFVLASKTWRIIRWHGAPAEHLLHQHSPSTAQTLEALVYEGMYGYYK